MERLLDNLFRTLELMGDSWVETTKIINSPLADFNSAAHLIKLQGLGFVERVIIDELSPFSKSKWRITKEGKSFKRLMKKTDIIQTVGDPSSTAEKNQCEIIMTLPKGFATTFLLDHPFVGLTYETITNLFREAREEINIFSPYIDASISFLMQLVDENVKIKVITTSIVSSNKRELPNATVERISQNKKLQTRYIRDTLDGVQMHQTHAKLIVVDSRIAYVGSANLKETSIFYNLELGYIIKEKQTINDLCQIFEDIFTNYSMGRELLA